MANNQFLTYKDRKLQCKPVNYYIYDKHNSGYDKNLNHSVFRYDRWRDEVGEPKGYFPLPEYASHNEFYKMDINDRDFYVTLRQNMSAAEKRKSLGYIIICFGGDLENLDLAEKLSEKLKEWGMSGYVKLFVKIRDGQLKREIVDKNSDGGFITFGNFDELVFDSHRIIAEEHEVMAKDRHICYTFEASDKQTDEEKLQEATNKWYDEWNQVQRESNVYACLDIRFKLQLLGFDVSREGVDASEEFLKAYQAGDEVDYKGEYSDGRPIVDYGDCRFKEGTARNILARQEHTRWSAYMIVNGYVPASIKEIKTVDKKALLNNRKHPNLTTYSGLKAYKRMMAKATGKQERDCDVIKYDYQIMDDVKWLVERHGYKIVSRRKPNKTN